ncbi:unnamed protein product [Tilletia controversa]|uniref:Peptidase A1 domain-containing protein n=3 Tax=Tilletia TaxID=13289 RepID=A0A8X7T042_9BASI|nr:hypothetical protein CF336_g3688 [Tilletia laevis]KAE8205770.1 hypothetical protein CF328_g290 [Tilletia controversa]KAE8261618.1 hypothetical protein A4X03_0g3103 [Tilletia caries]KAE8207234.1 hypothetical protein CF335_g1291 [Tilletia laevis]KAE8254437.1 hypothetical protein A4X06_0g894 [Tilletia controversa]
MKFSTVAAALVAGTILTSAAPAPSPKELAPLRIPIEKRGASLKKPDSDKVDFGKVSAHLDQLRSKYAKSLDNFRANTGKDHPLRVAVPAHKRSTGTVALTDVQENLWVGTLAYGTPAQSIKVDFDTGSADTLVNPGAYSPGSSSTSVRTSKTFSTAYGDGTTASGTVYTDVITIGGLKAAKTAIGLSTSTFIQSSQEGGNQGISGMSFPALATFGTSYPPFLDSLYKAGVLSAFEFSFKLGSSGSDLYLGGYNPSDISGSPTWVSVDTTQGFWQVPASATYYGGIESIVDTGTTLIVAPSNAASGYFSSIGVQQRTYSGTIYGAYNCNSPPPVSFTYGGKRIALDASAITIGTDDDGACLLSIVGEDTGLNAWISGDALLRNTLAIFDRTNSRVGFATRSAGPQ